MVLAGRRPCWSSTEISKSFGRVVVADRLSLRVAEGEMVGIVGPNGAGKTSLFSLISGDLEPDSGQVRLGGAVITRQSAAARCRLGIGRTYQVPRPFGAMTVFENVLVAVQQGGGLRRRASYARAAAILEQTGLAAEANSPAERLGLLQRKRLELARALATSPRLLLLDEVAGGLTDPEVAQLVEIVLAIRDRGRGHHLDRARRARAHRHRRAAALPGRRGLRRRRRPGRGAGAARRARGVPRHPGDHLPGRPGRRIRAGEGMTALPRGDDPPDPPAPASGGRPLLEVRDLTVHHGQLRALNQVSLTIGAGEVQAMIGANGAGKSTLLRTISGLKAATSGTITFDGADVGRLRAERRVAAGIVMVPEGRRLFPSLTVEENLQVGASYARPGPWSIERVYELFSWMPQRRRQLASQLSGGEQQAVAISRALVANPRLLLLDELSLGLAPVVVARIYDTLPELLASGVTVLLVEQDVSQALRVASRVHCLLEGRITLQGEPSRLTPAAIEEAYFGLSNGGPVTSPSSSGAAE